MMGLTALESSCTLGILSCPHKGNKDETYRNYTGTAEEES